MQGVQWKVSSSFRDLVFPKTFEYTTDGQNLPIEFYLDVIPLSKSIHLKLGYFSSKALRLLSCALAQFIYRGGTLNIISNHFVYGEDRALFSDAPLLAEELDLKNLVNIKSALTTSEEHFFNCLKYLRKQKKLRIVPVMLKPARMTHFKQGIFTDHFDNEIFMDGSCNFTANGLLENAETLSVFRLWESTFEKSKGRGKKSEMEAILNKENDQYQYLDESQLLDAVETLGEEKSLMELLTNEAKLLDASPDKFLSINRKLKEAAANLEKQIEEYNETPRFPFDTGPREYQKDAFSNWKQNDFKGIFLMATGTGKTITALNCLLNLYEMEGYYQSVILVPGKTLLKQWIGEAKAFNFRNIIPCSSEFKTWEQDLNKLQSNLKFNKKKSFVLITTYTTFSSEKFQRYFTKIPSPALLIADEAHAFGSPKLKTILEKLHIERRIALSATIKRQFDEDGNQAIERAFKSRHPYTYNFPMSKAIEEGVLCKYDYFPHFVQLNEQENEEYYATSKELLKYFDFETNRFKDSEYVQMLLIKRKRIIHKAEDKLRVFKSILDKHKAKYKTLSFSFVYAPEGDYESEDTEQKNILDEFIRVYEMNYPNYKAHAFTGKTESRDLTMQHFQNGLIDTLFSMKCLDEGVDVPRTELAIFCASSGNPRQFVQRRGRVLRKHRDKHIALIHDMVVIPPPPSDPDTFRFERKILKDEIVRVVYFASLARNYSNVMSLFESICKRYQIDLYGLQDEIEDFQ